MANWQVIRSALTYGGGFLFAVLIGSLLIGQVFGAPVLLSFVETGSMSPALDTGDGFVAVPAAVAGPVEEGDVITFEATELNGGGLTTHRVVEVTDHGYVTKGDANPFPDQDGDEPLVSERQVVAKALQVDGSVVVIPAFGTLIMGLHNMTTGIWHFIASTLGINSLLGPQGIAYAGFGIGLVLLLSDAITNRARSYARSRTRTRSRDGVYDGRKVLLGVLLIVGCVAFGTMFVASGTTETGIVSSDFESDQSSVIQSGTTETQDYVLSNGGVLPLLSVLEPASDGVAINDSVNHLSPGGNTTVSIGYSAPPETGYYVKRVAEYRYFAVLPTSVITGLQAIHPVIAMLAVTVTILIPIGAVTILFVGLNRVRTRNRRRESRRGLL